MREEDAVYERRAEKTRAVLSPCSPSPTCCDTYESREAQHLSDRIGQFSSCSGTSLYTRIFALLQVRTQSVFMLLRIVNNMSELLSNHFVPLTYIAETMPPEFSINDIREEADYICPVLPCPDMEQYWA